MSQRALGKLGLFLSFATALIALVAFSLQLTTFAAGQRSAKAAKTMEFKPVLTLENQGPAPHTGRLMVLTKGPISNAMLARLRNYGTVHGVIERYNLVAMTPRGPRGRSAIQRLPLSPVITSGRCFLKMRLSFAPRALICLNKPSLTTKSPTKMSGLWCCSKMSNTRRRCT